MPTMRSIARLSSWPLTVSLGFTLGLAGCGDDSTSTPDESSEGTVADTTTTTTEVTTTGADASTDATSTGAPADTSSDDGSSSSSAADESTTTGEPNMLPVAVDDLYLMVMGDGTLVLEAGEGVLINDSDPDGDALVVSDFDALSTGGGTVDIAADGSISFTPAEGFWGNDGFDYTIDDGNGGTATAHVRVAVMPTTVSLDQVASGSGGFVIEGTMSGDQAGWAVAGGGDVNGDGRADVLVGAYTADVDGVGTGRAYVVHGGAAPGTIALADVEMGEGGFVIDGIGDGDQTGHSIAHAGDVNGDGYADVIVGAPQADALSDDEGRAYVVFGKPDNEPVALASLEAEGTGFMVSGAFANDLVGWSVGGGVDVNGDGLDDVIVGAPQGDVNAFTDAGRAWVVFGRTDSTPVVVTSLGTGGFAIRGYADGDRVGDAVAGAGDVNGDGLEDVVIGSPLANPSGNNSGRAFVVFGRTATSILDLDDVAAGSGGFVIEGIAALDQAGDAVSGAGDVDGDGLCDVIIGALGAEDDLGLQGRSFVVLGKTDTTAVQLADVVGGAGGFLLEGQSEGDLSGWSVGGGGDIDADGRSDVLVGAQNGDYAGYLAGRSYVVYGRIETTEVPLGDIAAGSGGFAIDGQGSNDISGWSLSNAGDVSGDGFADLVIGAYAAPGNTDFGRAYVVFGGDFDASTGVLGTAGDDVLEGTDLDDNIVAGDGADVIHALAGFDTIYAGAGDDRIVLTSPNLYRINGGLGLDTLALDGADIVLDLGGYYETALTEIEGFDLTGTGDNLLLLEARDVRALSKTSNAITVVGDAGDQVVADLEGAGYVDMGVVDGFALYTNGVITLAVAQEVEVFALL
jgi:hypothetical protein